MKNIKRIIISLLSCAIAASMLSSCSTNTTETTTSVEINTTTASADIPEEGNVVRNNQVAMYSNSDEANYNPEPFSSYTFEFSNYEEKYMITIALNSVGNAFDLTLEYSNFDFYEFQITAPENYTLNIPYSQDSASTVCKVISNTVDDTATPDILEFMFYLDNFDDPSLPYVVKKFYSIKDNQLCEIKLIDNTLQNENGDIGAELEYCPDSTLFHTEPLVFMAAPQVEFDGKDASVNIYTYTLDAENMVLEKNLCDSSYETSPLYYGYAVHAIANNVAQYFNTTSLNVTDYENYVELPSVNNSDTSDYFFKVDDERFTTVDELLNFTKQYFSDKLTTDMFINAPQKYRDIDGSLYTIVGDGGYDFTLGQLTITDYSENGNVITYHTKQEKFNDEGDFTNFIDGGDFVIERNPDDNTFKVTQYRFCGQQ